MYFLLLLTLSHYLTSFPTLPQLTPSHLTSPSSSPSFPQTTLSHTSPLQSFIHFLTVSLHLRHHYPTSSLTPSHLSSTFSLSFPFVHFPASSLTPSQSSCTFSLFHFLSYTILPHPSPHSILHPLSHSVSFPLLLDYPTSSLTPSYPLSIFALCFTSSLSTLLYLIPHPIPSFSLFLTVSLHLFLHYPTSYLTPSHPSSTFSLSFISSPFSVSYLIPHLTPSHPDPFHVIFTPCHPIHLISPSLILFIISFPNLNSFFSLFTFSYNISQVLQCPSLHYKVYLTWVLLPKLKAIFKSFILICILTYCFHYFLLGKVLVHGNAGISRRSVLSSSKLFFCLVSSLLLTSELKFMFALFVFPVLL